MAPLGADNGQPPPSEHLEKPDALLLHYLLVRYSDLRDSSPLMERDGIVLIDQRFKNIGCLKFKILSLLGICGGCADVKMVGPKGRL
ncbi:hypothetical protein FRX31_035102 [Thalictrum thalictroides]|uniref:Uncharacterized protein n=1 Tax=Thalictrum thalictroides TaxID=46969 RepID=A0A7J6US78_THATH|nr:hypothetical protein FRX31_035102 [Thalictrum thalictroides]